MLCFSQKSSRKQEWGKVGGIQGRCAADDFSGIKIRYLSLIRELGAR